MNECSLHLPVPCPLPTHPSHSQCVSGVLEDGPERGPPRLVVEGPAAGDVSLAGGARRGGGAEQGVAQAAQVTVGCLQEEEEKKTRSCHHNWSVGPFSPQQGQCGLLDSFRYGAVNFRS